MTWRLAMDHQRSHKRRTRREEVHTESFSEQATADPLLEQERAKLLWRVVDALPEKQRILVVLANIEEHSMQEVATFQPLRTT